MRLTVTDQGTVQTISLAGQGRFRDESQGWYGLTMILNVKGWRLDFFFQRRHALLAFVEYYRSGDFTQPWDGQINAVQEFHSVPGDELN